MRAFLDVRNIHRVLCLCVLLCGIATSGARAEERNGFQAISAQPISPVDAVTVLSVQPVVADAYDSPLIVRAPNSSSSLAVARTMAFSPVAGPDSITELARALKHDPALIFEYVYQNIEYEPTFGSKKGIWGTLVDGRGNAFDIAQVLVALLREANVSASYQYGTVTLPESFLTNWLGLRSINTCAALDILNDGGIPASGTRSVGSSTCTLPSGASVGHVWVTAVIDGSTYVFDPALKTYEYGTKIDVASAMGYDNVAFLSVSRQGRELDADHLKGLNGSGMVDMLETYTANLVNHLRSQYSGATLDEVLEGRKIVSTAGIMRTGGHPYLAPGAQVDNWTEIPNTYRSALTVNIGGINKTLYADAIYGRRLMLTYGSNVEPMLSVDGTVVATGAPFWLTQMQTLTLSVNEPYAQGNGSYGDYSVDRKILAGCKYLIMNEWSGATRGMMQAHRDRLMEAEGSGAAPDSDIMQGETFSLLAFQLFVQQTMFRDILSSVTGVHLTIHSNVGIISGDGGLVFDWLGSNVSGQSLDGVFNNYAYAISTLFTAGSALEGGAMQQSFGVEGVSTVSLFAKANASGTTFYRIDAGNWQGIKPKLKNYSASFLNTLEEMANLGFFCVILEDGQIPVGSWSGTAYFAHGPDGDKRTGYRIGRQYNGGILSDVRMVGAGLADAATQNYSQPETKGNVAQHPASVDPIDLFTGAFVYEHEDLSSGAASLPFGLGVRRSYSSGNRMSKGPMGRGWSHNFDVRLSLDSDGMQGLGEDSAVDAAAAIVTAYVGNMMVRTSPQNLETTVLSFIVQDWGMRQRVGNSVTVTQPGNVERFLRLPDGSFNPPPGSASTLTKNGDGSYAYRTKEGVTLAFGADLKLSTWSDSNGNTLTFSYGDGTLSSVSGLGRTLTFTYTDDLVSQIGDGSGRSVSYAYDAVGNLTGVTDATGATTTFAYDAPGRLVNVFYPGAPDTPFVTNVYDGLGRVKEQYDAGNNLRQYFLAGYRAEEIDPLGNRMVLYNDRLGRVIRQVDALGKETVIDRDSHERPVKVTYPEGNSVQYAYDANHNPLTVTVNPKPGAGVSPLVSRYTYDPTFSRVTTVTDPLGRVTRHTIDPANGNLLRVDYPAVGGQIPRQSFVYDGRGQVTSATDPMGKVTSFVYDGVTGALASVTDDAGRLDLTVSYSYDAAGNVASRTDPLGRTTSFVYDGARRLIQRTSPSPFNYRTQWVYNADGNVVQFKRQSGSSTWSVSQTTWSPSGRKLTETSPAGNVTTYAYDALDRVWKVTDAENRTTETRYDGVGRVAMVVDALGNMREQYAYSDNGLPRSLTDARGRVTVYGYDGFDRLSRVTQPDGSYAERGYDASGNVVSLRTRAGQTITYGHDALNRRVRKVYPGGVVVSFGYDLSGRPTEVGDGGGTLVFGYDSAGRPVSQTWPDGKVLQSEYDAAGQRTRLTYPDGWSVNWSYDGLGRPTAIVENGTRNLVRYTYDALSRRTQAVMGNTVTSTYSWNADDQLTRVYHYKVGRTPPVSFIYGRNRVGQITTVTATDGRTSWRPAANDILSASVNDLDQYVTFGAASLDYDMGGNLSGDGVVGYGYDAENRLVSATQPGHTASYAYDGLGRRRSKTVDGVTTRYLQDGADEVAEVDGAGGQLLRKHVFGPGVDAPVLTIETDGTRTWHLADGQGNVVWQASNTGADVALTGYGPWGESTGTTGAFRYAGARFDAETGLVYLRARHYSPTLGRFLQPDPVGTAGGVNLYAYALNDPINRRDPRGTTSGPVSGVGGNWGLMGGAGDGYLFSGDARGQRSLGGQTIAHDGTIATTRVGWDGTIITERSDEYYALSPMERQANDVHEGVHVEQYQPYSGRGVLGALESRIDYALNPPKFEIPAYQAQIKFLESYRTTTDIDDRVRYNAILRARNNLEIYEKRK